MSTKKDAEALILVLEKIDELGDRAHKDFQEMRRELTTLNNIQIKQQAILEEHMRRTAANEALIATVREEQMDQAKEVMVQLEPIKQHVAMWGGAGKVIALLGTLIGIGYAIFRMWPHS